MSVRLFCRSSGRCVALASFLGALASCAASTPAPASGAAGALEASEEASSGVDPALRASAAEDGADDEAENVEEPDVLGQHPNAELALARVKALSDDPSQTLAEDQAAAGVRIEIGERGPGLPWTLALVNVSTTGQRLQGDPRLLRFDVLVPGRKTPIECALPKSLQPARPNADFELTLAPGEAAFESFDPRLYCFAQNGQSALVPGAIVTPHFGWKRTTKVRWEHGKRVEVPDPKPPYVSVAVPVPERHARAQHDPSTRKHDGASEENLALEDNDVLEENDASDDAADADHAPSDGSSAHADSAGPQPGGAKPATPPAAPEPQLQADQQQELRGTPFALSSEYASWARERLAGSSDTPEPLELRMEGGSDVDTDRSASVVVALKNKSTAPISVFIRRELVSYEVMGPDGLVHCDAKPDDRAPDALAFTSLAPGKTLSIPSRLIELCPRQTFARAGLYLVHARFDSSESGAEAGVKAYVGSLSTLEPATVRIQTGERPLFEDYHMSLVPTDVAPRVR